MAPRTLSLVVVAALAVAACGSSGDSSDADESVDPASSSGVDAAPSTSSTLLEPPPTTTTTVAPTTSTTTTTTTTTTIDPGPDLSGLVLRGDGLGPVQVGADADGAIDYFASILGAPTQDTGWVDPFDIGLCPGTELRLVSWGALTITLGDESPIASGRRHFVAYSYGIDGEVGFEPAGLMTPEGITIGSSVAALTAAYPDVILIPEDDFAAPTFLIDDTRYGYLTGLGDDDVVTVLFGGQGCGE